MQNFDFGQGGNMMVIAAMLVAVVQHFFPSVKITSDDILALFGLVGGAISWYITMRDKQLNVAGFHPASNPG